MAQGEYTEDDLFSTDTTDIQELDDMFNITKADSEDIIPASEEDKKKEKEAGKPKPEKEAVKEPEEKIIGSELDETDEQEEKPKTDKTTKEEVEEQSPISEYGELSKGLFKTGIWNRDEDEDVDYFPDSEEEFIERFQYEGQKMANGYISQVATRHGEEAKELFDAVYIKGVPVKEYTSKWQESQDFKAMDMTDETNQEIVVRTAYEQQGIPSDKINEKIKKLRLAEDLEDEANTWHTALVKRQETDLQKMEQDSQRKLEQKKQATLQYNSNIDTILADALKTQELNGVPVNTKTSDSVKDMLKTKKWKLGDGTLITDWDRMMMEIDNPANHAVKAQLSLLFKPYQPGKPLELNLEAVGKRKETKEVQDKFFNLGKGKKPQTSAVPSKNTETVNLLADL